MIILRDATLLDYLLLANGLPDDERQQIEVFSGVPYDAERTAYAAFGFAGPKWAGALDDGKPIAAGGFIPQRPGVVQSWFLSSALAWDEHALETTRICALIVKEMLGQAHRLETLVLASRRAARLWYTRIGLHLEATLPGYGCNGATAMLYTAVRSAEGS